MVLATADGQEWFCDDANVTGTTGDTAATTQARYHPAACK